MPPFLMSGSTDGGRSVAGRASVQPSSEGVNASSEEGLGNPPFFWQFVKSALDTPSCLEMVELLGAPAFSTRSSPSTAAFPAAFFIACGRPNHERSSPPLLTVLPLLIARDQEEGYGASEREDGTSEGGNTSGVFFEVPEGPDKSVGGNVGGISVSVGELVPGGLQRSYLEVN